MAWAMIKRWKYPVLAVLALIFFLTVVDPFAESILRSSQERKHKQRQIVPRWQWLTNHDCGYIVEFPSRPFENPYTLSNNQNVISYRQFASTLGSNSVFMVATLVPAFTNTFTDDEIKLLLSKATQGALARGDKLLTERDISIGVNLGKEVEILKADGEFVKMRFYQIGHNLQELVVSVPTAVRQSPNISRFLDSFTPAPQ